MSIETLLFVAIALGFLAGVAGLTYAALTPLRLLLGFEHRGGVDVVVSTAFTIVFLGVLLEVMNHHSSLSWIALLALPVFLAGLLSLCVALFEAPKRGGLGERRERLLVGAALIGTALVIVYFGRDEPYGLFSDVATSVSRAPGP
jgi:hypothetical protein